MRQLNVECWAGSTFRMTRSYFLLQILPRLDRLGVNPTPEDITKLHNDLVEQASENKNSLGISSQARKNLVYKLRRCDALYRQLQILMPECCLPDLDLRMEGAAVPDMEQVKSLSEAVRLLFAALLMRLAETPWGGVALSLAFMMLCGLRTSESGALFYDNITWSGGIGTIWVNKQLSGDGLTEILKTSHAYRRLPLVQYLEDMLAVCREWLSGQGYTQEEILRMPILGHPADPTKLIHSNLLSAAGRLLLQICGCKEQDWEKVRALMLTEPDTQIDGSRMNDMTAYVLRRDFASRAANVCGIKAKALDMALGHKVKLSIHERRAFYSDESMEQFCRELERYVFDPNHTRNPAFSAIPVNTEPCMISPVPYTKSTFFAPEDGVLEFTAETLDAGQPIRLEISCGELLKIQQFSAVDQPDERHARPLLGKIHEQVYYEETIAGALDEKLRQAAVKKLEEVFGSV